LFLKKWKARPAGPCSHVFVEINPRGQEDARLQKAIAAGFRVIGENQD